jgi:hypothetical protein
MSKCKTIAYIHGISRQILVDTTSGVISYKNSFIYFKRLTEGKNIEYFIFYPNTNILHMMESKKRNKKKTSE